MKRITWCHNSSSKSLGIYISKRYDGLVWITIELWNKYVEIDLVKGE